MSTLTILLQMASLLYCAAGALVRYLYVKTSLKKEVQVPKGFLAATALEVQMLLCKVTIYD